MRFPVAEGETLSVEVTDIAFPNDFGVARYAGGVLFVPKGLPGDVLRVRVRRCERRYALAEILEVERPSAGRIVPQCPHFADCGGCSIQHLGYEQQLDVKAAHLKETLRRIGGVNPDSTIIRKPVQSPETFFYRSKIELAAAEGAEGLFFGLRERDVPWNHGPPGIVPAYDCRIFHPRLRELLPVAERLARNLRLRPFGPAGNAGLKYLVLRHSKSTGQTMAVIEAEGKTDNGCVAFAQALAREVAWIDSIYTAVLSGAANYRIIDRLTHQHGAKNIVEEIDGLRLNIYPASFFQPNPGAARLLYRTIAERATLGGAERVLGLFCGTGCIELAISRRALSVTGVDSLPDNIANARENALMNDRTNCTFHAATVEQFLQRLHPRQYDKIILDPPRSGLPRSALNRLVRSGIQEIFYVSCSPATLARDLRMFNRFGYRTEEIIPFDFFPHTSHLEALAILRKA